MKDTYYNQAKAIFRNEFGLDIVHDVILHRNDKIICYAQIHPEEDLVMHLISGSFEMLDLIDQPSLPLSTLFTHMDLDNAFARVGGKKEYYDAVVGEIMNFTTESNTTFPIRPKNKRIWIRLTTDCIDDAQHLLALHFTIVTPYIQNEEDVFYKTHHDSLTGLFNKYTFDFHYGSRYQNEHFHVMFLDLDDFKEVNDKLGHRTGDTYLQNFAKILQSHENDHSRFYRLGGDEFIGLLFDSEQHIRAMAEDILKQTVELSQDLTDITTSVSIGIVQATKREDVARKADHVMYQAKQSGKNRYFYIVEE